MASENRIIKINDKNLRRTRLKKYLRVYKGDVFRISRINSLTSNEVIQQLGLSKISKISKNSSSMIVTDVRKGSNKINHQSGISIIDS